jgi:TusA-related sulfurtransferase
MEKDQTLDCFGLMCPVPIIKMSEKIKEMNEGEVLEVIATDGGIKPDAAAWCRSTGHTLLGVEEEAGDPTIYRAYIRK